MSLSTGLIAYWRLEEESGTRADSVGSNTLSDGNTVLYTTGVQGNCADFEATASEYLYIADNADTSFGNEDFSISCWMRFEALPAPNGTYGIVCKYDNGATVYEYSLMYRETAGQYFRWYVGADNTFTVYATINDNNQASTGQWYHIVVYHDAGNDQTGLIINNGTPSTASYSGGCHDDAAAFTLGAWSDPASYHDGEIDEVGVWGKVLSAAEITLLYNGGDGLSYPFTFENLAGAVAFSGAVTKKGARPLTGAVTFSGTVTKKAKRILDGVVTFTGNVTKKGKKVLAGAITFSGILYRRFIRLFGIRFEPTPSGRVQFGASTDADDDNVRFDDSPEGFIREQ